MSDVLKDPSAERAVLAGIMKYGFNSYIDVSDMVSASTFTDDTNKALFKCCKSILERDNNASIDLPSLMVEARSQGFHAIVDNRIEVQHIRAIFDYPIMESNVPKMGAKVRKLEIARQYKEVLRSAVSDLNGITGEEKLAEILGLVEGPLHQFSAALVDGSANEPKPLTNAMAFLKNIEANPNKAVGISSGFKYYDAAIGGGFRPGTVNVIGARTKVGKTFLCNNIGLHVAQNLKIPVLSLDTEMMEEDQYTRMLGILSGVEMDRIVGGLYVNNSFEKERVYKAAKYMDTESSMFKYLNIAGRDFEDILSIMRRWVMRDIGRDEMGNTKPCLLIYDYIKLMDPSGLSAAMQEYQMLGFLLSSMHNLCVNYKIPILSTVQLNRDGIDDETTATVSGSDRITWLCSNLSIYKMKSNEEVAADGGIQEGSRKLITVAARHGPGMHFGQYVSMKFHDVTGKIAEGKTRSELAAGPNDNQNNRLDIGDEEVPFED